MTIWRLLFIAYVTFICAEAKWNHHQKRETDIDVCDPVYNNTNKVQCYCLKDNRESNLVKNADCYLTNEGVKSDDSSWIAFKSLKNVNRLTLTNTRGIILKYIPTDALKQLNSLLKLDIKYASIEKIEANAFANLSFVGEISLSGNQIKVLEKNAFAHHKDLMIINLDTNNIEEINRDVFVDLPSLDKLFLTSNQITTLHDRAFVHLSNLKELEIDSNKIFSLNNETFSGLKNLIKLDLSMNNLEVIGDNTFLPLESLKFLNLERNKIQMLDEKAFNGLGRMQSLSLARNKLVDIENEKIFQGLTRLTALSLRENQIRELKAKVMLPILSNFYGNVSSLDVENNKLPCTCSLEWFINLMNQTRNGHLKLSIENLKCQPDNALREEWVKFAESARNTGLVSEEVENTIANNNDYEYYDDTQLNGTLFYIDVRELLNCTGTLKHAEATKKNTKIETTTTTVAPKAVPTAKPLLSTEYKLSKKKNPGLLDLSSIDTTTASITQRIVTTTKLTTVSEKPVGDFDNMAADEAKPDKIKAHRSIQDEEQEPQNLKGSAVTNSCKIYLIMFLLCFKLGF